MDVQINKYSVGASNGRNILPNNNILYGPYDSIDNAYDIIYAELEDAIPIGLTVGIKDNSIIKEYWFSGGIEKQHLVEKGSWLTQEEYNEFKNSVIDFEPIPKFENEISAPTSGTQAKGYFIKNADGVVDSVGIYCCTGMTSLGIPIFDLVKLNYNECDFKYIEKSIIKDIIYNG